MKSKTDFKTDNEYVEYLRTYFAGLAMQSMVIHYHSGNLLKGWSMADCATEAVDFADELIKALNK